MLAILLLPRSYFGLLNYNILSESMNYETEIEEWKRKKMMKTKNKHFYVVSCKIHLNEQIKQPKTDLFCPRKGENMRNIFATNKTQISYTCISVLFS